VRLPRIVKKIFATLGIMFLVAGGVYYYAITPHHTSAPPDSATGLLDRADTLAWGNRWADALPLYEKAERLYTSQHELSKALYAQVSQIPQNESVSIPATLWALTQDLARPEAADLETRLRILTIRGMLETNYNASGARSTWRDVAALAIRLHHYELATRAIGEQGIAAFILGDTETAKAQVIRAWELSKVENDPAATVRYASVFGAGLVQLHRFKEALLPLNQAIKIAEGNPALAYPTIAVYAKIDALAGLQQYEQALTLANESLARLQGTPYDAHKAQVYLSRGTISKKRGDWNAAIADYQQSVDLSRKISNYRGVTDADGLLAEAYQHNGNLPAALAAINSAIDANTKVPDELYLVPRNLAIKAEIIETMGQAREADGFYQRSIALVDGMIQHAATTNIQRQLLAEMSDVYSGYFASLCTQKRYDDALQVLERVRGRVETEALEHHASQLVHAPTPDEQELTRLNLALINTDNPAARSSLIREIDNTELKISPSALAQQTIVHPVHLADVQRNLSPNALLIEYVLAERSSYVLAITQTSVKPYHLPAKTQIESDSNLYRREIRAQKVDLALAQRLFTELLNPIKEYHQKTDLIIVPDSSLHLLPFAALADKGSYVLKTHTVDVAPSSTVFDLLRKRLGSPRGHSLRIREILLFAQSPDRSGANLPHSQTAS
jgi:tetratricopeptide (TPR) repeat protein